MNEDLKQEIISDTFYVVPAMQAFVQQKASLTLSKAATGKMLKLHFNLLNSFFNDDAEDEYDTAHLLYVWWTLFSRSFSLEYPKWDLSCTIEKKEALIVDIFVGTLLLATKYSLESTVYTSDFSSLMIESMPQQYKDFKETTESLKILERQCLDTLTFRLTPNTTFETEEKAYEAMQQVQSYAKTYVKLKKYPEDKKSKQLFDFLHQAFEKSILEANTPVIERSSEESALKSDTPIKESVLDQQHLAKQRTAKKIRS